MEGVVNTNPIGVKLNYEGQMRRFPYTGVSYAAFYEQILALLGLDKSSDIVLKYTDEEGDQITISSDLELKSALVPGQLLRINVLPRSRVPPVPNVPQIQPHDPSQLYHHPAAQHFQQHAAPAFPGMEAPFPFPPHHPPHHGHPHHPPPHHRPPHHHHHPSPPPPPGFAPFTPGGNFGAFKHGCGGGEKWERKVEKLQKEGKYEKIADMNHKHWKKMVKHGHYSPHHMMGPYHVHPHHHKHHHKKDKKDKKDKEDKLTARYVSDVSIEDGTSLPPNTPFVKTWRLRNEGPAWPQGCVLMFISKKSHDLSSPEVVPLEGEVGTGVEVNVSVNLVSPAKPGRYTGYWRLCTADGRKFGQRVWTSIVVPSPDAHMSNSSEEEREADKYEALVDVVLRNETFRSLGIKRHWVFRLLQKTKGDVDKVQEILNKKIEKKLSKHKL